MGTLMAQFTYIGYEAYVICAHHVSNLVFACMPGLQHCPVPDCQ